MSLPYAPNCTNGQGIRQSHLATGYLTSPRGRCTGAICSSCAQEVIDEYKEKLGQVWTFEPQEWQQVDPNRPMYVYGNPFQGESESQSQSKTSQSESIPHYVDLKDQQLQRICSYENVNLPENTIPSEIDCPWCEANVGDIHSRTCPNGERYKQAKEIRDSAASLGRLGGKAKTEKKVKAAKENGKRGGRPQTNLLDMGDI